MREFRRCLRNPSNCALQDHADRAADRHIGMARGFARCEK
jgi:hypothetical protein